MWIVFFWCLETLITKSAIGLFRRSAEVIHVYGSIVDFQIILRRPVWATWRAENPITFQQVTMICIGVLVVKIWLVELWLAVRTFDFWQFFLLEKNYAELFLYKKSYQIKLMLFVTKVCCYFWTEKLLFKILSKMQNIAVQNEFAYTSFLLLPFFFQPWTVRWNRGRHQMWRHSNLWWRH